MTKKESEKEDRLDYLLTDNFQEFAAKIAQIHADKKKKKESLKQIYEKVQQELKQLDLEAKKIYDDFENWKKEQSKDMEGGDQI